MPSNEPTVLATSGGHRLGDRTMVEFDAAYVVVREGGSAVEERIEPRLLPQP